MDDAITKVLKTLKGHDTIRQTRFDSSFLANVGDVLGREGFGAVKVFLLDKLDRQHHAQSRALLDIVIPLLEKEPQLCQNRGIARYILKSLNTLKSEEVEL